MWIVASRTNIALLSFQDVHNRHFISTDDSDMYFTNR
jgi:hypothetical protein